MQEIPPKFHDCAPEDLVEVAEGFLASFSPLTWWLYFPICFLNYYLTFWWNAYILLGSIILYKVNNLNLIVSAVVVIWA